MEIVEMAKQIEGKGGRLYLVGGAVRDKYMNIEPHDTDYCVTGLNCDEFEELFPKAYKRGKFFCVYDIEGIEFALARRDIKTGEKHTDFEVQTDKNITIEEDLQRRDVTINSIAIDVLTGKVIDPFGGIKDIENRVIRATSNAFADDALRVYRVAVLATKYGFDIEENTLNLMRELKPTLNYISGERVLEELKKALRCDKPSIFFDVLRKVDCLDVHFKEIYDLIGVIQPVQYHPEGDAYNHTMEVVDRAAQMTKETKIRFAALTHDLGKAKTRKENWPHHYGHEKYGVHCIASLCNRLHVSNQWRKAAIVACSEHMIGGMYDEIRTAKKVDLIDRVYRTSLGIEGLEIIVNSDKHPEKKIEFAEIGKYIMENINGKEMVNITDYNVLKEKVRAKRIRYLQTLENTDVEPLDSTKKEEKAEDLER